MYAHENQGSQFLDKQTNMNRDDVPVSTEQSAIPALGIRVINNYHQKSCISQRIHQSRAAELPAALWTRKCLLNQPFLLDNQQN
jgi:hypothetical protein